MLLLLVVTIVTITAAVVTIVTITAAVVTIVTITAAVVTIVTITAAVAAVWQEEWSERFTSLYTAAPAETWDQSVLDVWREALIQTHVSVGGGLAQR